MDRIFELMEYTPIYGITPFTLLDYNGKISSIIWIAGCNMRCGYCHNPEIVKSRGKYSYEYAISFLKERRNLLEGVVISGGEASMSPGIFEFIQEIKKLGFLVKLDTNGTNPNLINKLISESMIDFISLDYKAPFHKYNKITGLSDFSKFLNTLSILCDNFSGNFEVRTTIHTDLLDENDINEIISNLEKVSFKESYYIQNFRFNKDYPNLGNLEEQKRIIDKNMIKKTDLFNVHYRNF